VTPRRQVLLWAAQRFSGALLGLCVTIHLVTIIYTVRHGLSAAEILGRTRGKLAWAGFYVLFVIAVAVHAPLGVRAIAAEWFGWRGRTAELATVALGTVFVGAGLRAVAGVYA
jgi:fumarate reductase subunit C